MHTNEPREDPLVEMGYEVRDIDVPKTRMAILIFLGFGLFSAIAGWFIYANRDKVFALNTAGESTSALKRRLPEAPNPELQNNMTSKTDIAVMRRQEHARLTGTGYTDDTRQFVHIPIDLAMSMIVQKGITPTHRTVPATSAPADRSAGGRPLPPTEGAKPSSVPNANPGTVPGHETTGSSVPATPNGTRDVPVGGVSQPSANKPGGAPHAP